MPSVEIKAAVKTRLDASFGTSGDGRLKHVFTQYPRLGLYDAQADYPRVTISAGRHTAQKQEAGGRASVLTGQPTPPLGYRTQLWEIVVHLKHLLDDTIANGDAYDQLADDIETMLAQWPTLNNAGGSTPSGTGFNAMEWRVDWSGDIARENVPPLPTATDMQLAYNTLITLRVAERIKA